jgi:hypothetical protein
MSNTFNSLVEAVQVSGKKFTEINKEAIFGFLDKQGEPRNSWESTYQKLSEFFNPKNKSNSSSGFAGIAEARKAGSKEDRTHKSAVVDYTDNSHNDVKVRQPRKSVFGEVKKIAG